VYCARQRPMVRSITPIISAASHHFSLPAIAFKITSCIFIIRSVSSGGIRCLTPSTSTSFPLAYLKRTFHLLIEADKSHATDNHESAPTLDQSRYDILSETLKERLTCVD
jgi:hypothetical protein